LLIRQFWIAKTSSGPTVVSTHHFQGIAKTLKYVTCSTFRDASFVVNLLGGDPVPLIHNKPHHNEPSIESNSAVVKDSSSFDREAAAGVPGPTLPAIVSFQKGDFLAPAARAFDAMGPATRENPFTAVLRISKEYSGFLESSRFHRFLRIREAARVRRSLVR
jgi:hypothetical protein